MTTISSTAAARVVQETVGSGGGQVPAGAREVTGAPLLPDPASTAAINMDAGQAMAMLMIDSAFARRTTAREAKTKAESASADAQSQQLHRMREAAEHRYDAAQMDAWVQIGSGAVTLAGTRFGTGGMNVAGGVSSFAKGIGGLASSAERRAAERADASAKQHELTAKLMKDIGEDWGDDVRAAKESVRKALDFLKEYQSTQSQTQAAALHRA
jgi:hypothetical protein